MSGKKSLLFGALIGGIAASATVYALKTENGKQLRDKASAKLKELGEVIEETIENREDVIEFVKVKVQDTKDNFKAKPNTQSVEISPVHSIKKERIERELAQLQREISVLETNM